ncbi:MAG: ankyrin repeat domain-containing protein [Candidatus Anstonellales archaeon]
MAIEKEDKKGKEKKGSSKGIERSGLKEERMGEDVVIKRVLEAVRSGKEDKEAFEELKRINRERKGEDNSRAERLGKKLINECKKEKEKISLERVVKLVLEGADVNVKDNDGETALMYAAENRHEEVVEMLLKAGADPFIVNNDGESAYDLAGNEEIKKMLDNYMKRIKRVLRKMEKEEGLNKKEEKLMKVALKMALNNCNKIAGGLVERLLIKY